MLRAEGVLVNSKRVQRLMRLIGIAALGPKPRTSKPAPGHKIYPYLLRGVKIERPNHVWAMDICYIPMRRGFVYLAAVVDVASRRVLAHRVSITMEAGFCVEALEEALARHGKPEIFNTVQGSQFASLDFTSVPTTAGVSISMDGKGAWRDNVFVERRWRTIKYEEVYLLRLRRRVRGAGVDFFPPIWRSTIEGARTRALTGARPTPLQSRRAPRSHCLNSAGRCPNNRGQLSWGSVYSRRLNPIRPSFWS